MFNVAWPGQAQRSQIMSEAKICDAKICDINRCMIFFLEPLNDVNLMHIKRQKQPGMLVHACNPRTQEGTTEGSGT